MGTFGAATWAVREGAAEYGTTRQVAAPGGRAATVDFEGAGVGSYAAALAADAGAIRSAAPALQPAAAALGSAAAALASDAREERMDRVAVLYAEITAATREFLAALADSDRHRDWAEEGFGSCAEWLAWRIGITRNTANEKVRVAHALERLPLISDAMARGELSFAKVRALTRAATPESEPELLELARAGSAANLERVVRGRRQLGRWDEARQERIRHASRFFSVFPDGDGMYALKGRLTPEVAAVLMRAVEAASDALFAAGRREGSGSGESNGTASNESDGPDGSAASDGNHGTSRDATAERATDDDTEHRQRRADALGLVAERALAAGFESPVSGSRADRYQVVLHVEAATLQEHTEPGQSELEDGTRVSAVTARRLACDAGRVEVRHAADGSILDVGRKTRTVPPSLRRALEARDRGCRFPGCGSRFTDAHHIVHWADGGETSLKNTLLLCGRHHRRVHEEGWRVYSDRDGRQVVFFTPKGKALFDAPPMATLPAGPPSEVSASAPPDSEVPPPSELPRPSAESLRQRNRSRGIAPGDRSGAPRYRRDVDMPWEIEAAALEALEAGVEDTEAAAVEALEAGVEGSEPPL